MFESDGGLVNQVRTRLLQRALNVLASPAHRHLRVVDVALQHGFATESGFIRAFRRQFGITPSEARKEPTVEAGTATRSRHALSWLVALASTPPSPRA